MTHLDPQDSHIDAEGDFVVREGGVGLVPKGGINMADVRPPRPTPETTEKLPVLGVVKWVELWRNPQEGKVIDITAHTVEGNDGN
jgi:hypothetical protein